MGDRSRESSVVSKVRVDMDRVEVARDLGVRLVRRGRVENRAVADRHCVPIVGERAHEALRVAVTLEVLNDGVATGVVLEEVDRGNLDEALDLIADEDVSRHVDRLEAGLVTICDLRADAEDERCASLKRLGLVVPLEPFLGLQNAYGCVG